MIKDYSEHGGKKLSGTKNMVAEIKKPKTNKQTNKKPERNFTEHKDLERKKRERYKLRNPKSS